MRKLLLASVATIAGTLALTGGAQAQPAKAPAPGTVVVHLNGWFDFEAVALNNPNSSSKNSGSTKFAPINTVGLFRLYPGFDATTKDGLQYGVASEIRDTLANPNGAGVNGNTTSPNGTVSLYVRRAYGYIGAKDAGYVRFGQTDSAFSLMSYGDIEAFGDYQQFNSDLGTAALIYNGAPKNLFAVSGALYTTSKIVYESPSFAGLNFAVGFEPNSNGLAEGTAGNQSGASAISGSSPSRRRNTIDAMVGYTTEMDGVGLKASAGYLDASPLGNTGGAQPYKNMGIFQAGGQVTFGGAALGVNYKDGSVNDGYTFVKSGQRNDSDILVSGTYTAGPVILGASYFFNQSAGASAVARTETSNGLAVGANYVFTPNLNLFVQYLYGQIHQVGNSGAGPNGNGHTNAIGVGASLHW
ncbi:MAG: porin [Acidocella sp.]|nr:porin [Acidocella sp.]